MTYPDGVPGLVRVISIKFDIMLLYVTQSLDWENVHDHTCVFTAIAVKQLLESLQFAALLQNKLYLTKKNDHKNKLRFMPLI